MIFIRPINPLSSCFVPNSLGLSISLTVHFYCALSSSGFFNSVFRMSVGERFNSLRVLRLPVFTPGFRPNPTLLTVINYKEIVRERPDGFQFVVESYVFLSRRIRLIGYSRHKKKKNSTR